MADDDRRQLLLTADEDRQKTLASASATSETRRNALAELTSSAETSAPCESKS